MKTDLRNARQNIWNDTRGVKLCAVTKNHTIPEINDLIHDLPKLKIIAENRWPACEEKFLYFTNLEKHFIGPLQGNKVKKVVPLVDVIQSVHSFDLLKKINESAKKNNKIINFCFQVNISNDPMKHGMDVDTLETEIEAYKQAKFKNVELIGLMTIGAQSDIEDRKSYFREFRKLFENINYKYFPEKSLKTLSMGMSEDYKEAIEAGSTMVRVGSALFS